MKTTELSGNALNWAVAKCEGIDLEPHRGGWIYAAYLTNWAQGGPIIEREGIDIWQYSESLWRAMSTTQNKHIPNEGLTPLIAAMRCYVASKLGDNVDIPKELT